MSDSHIGQFQGRTLNTQQFDGVVATETEYSYRFIDWHYHRNPYFSLVMTGNCREVNQRETIDFTADALVFHNHHEPHSSVKESGTSRHFQIEFSTDWCRRFEIDPDDLPASTKLLNPKLKLLFHQIYRETKRCDPVSALTIDTLLLQAWETMRGVTSGRVAGKPGWVARIDEMLHENFDQTLSLKELSHQLDLHSAHLSRDFPRYFRCTFGEYLRMIRVEKALPLLRNQKVSLTEIAAHCGFADQSHFIRCFKEFLGITPKAYRKIVVS